MEKDDDLYLNMMSYYAAKAFELDQYWNRDIYPHTRETQELFYERRVLDEIASNFIRGVALDIACGSGHYMECYYNNCFAITLVDQSDEMLSICKNKIKAFHRSKKIITIKEDIFDLDLQTDFYDCTVLGYILGHLTHSMQNELMCKICTWLKPKARLFVVDSMVHDDLVEREWNSSEFVRTVNSIDYQIYKHYFACGELEELLSNNGFTVLPDSFLGRYFSGIVAIKD